MDSLIKQHGRAFVKLFRTIHSTSLITSAKLMKEEGDLQKELANFAYRPGDCVMASFKRYSRLMDKFRSINMPVTLEKQIYQLKEAALAFEPIQHGATSLMFKQHASIPDLLTDLQRVEEGTKDQSTKMQEARTQIRKLETAVNNLTATLVSEEAKARGLGPGLDDAYWDLPFLHRHEQLRDR